MWDAGISFSLRKEKIFLFQHLLVFKILAVCIRGAWFFCRTIWSFNDTVLVSYWILETGITDALFILNIRRVDPMKEDQEENGEAEKMISVFHALEFILRILEQKRFRSELPFSIRLHPGRL